MWIEVDTHASKQGLMEINKIETKQQKSKSKSNRKSKVVEYTIFEDKFEITEYITCQDGGSNSLSHVKSELVVSYSNFPFEQNNFTAKPTVLTAKQSPFFKCKCNTAVTACARKIAVHLCRR